MAIPSTITIQWTSRNEDKLVSIIIFTILFIFFILTDSFFRNHSGNELGGTGHFGGTMIAIVTLA
jgi:hypothetical protein